MATEDGVKKTGIDALSPIQQFLILGCGVFVFFGTHNVLQEAMMKIPGFEFGVMLGYMEVVGYVHFRVMDHDKDDALIHSFIHFFFSVFASVPLLRERLLPKKRHVSLLSRPIRS